MLVLGEFLRALEEPRRVKVIFPKDYETKRVTLSQFSDKIPVEYNKYNIKQFNVVDDEITVYLV